MLGKLYDEQRGRKPRRKGFLMACTSVYSAFWHKIGCNSPIISYRYRHHHRFYYPRHYYHYRIRTSLDLTAIDTLLLGCT